MDERLINIYEKRESGFGLEVIIILLIILLALMSIFRLSEVKGISMLPGIESGDIVIMTDKKVKREDIVIVQSTKLLIKRMIGLPGDTIEFRENGKFAELYINGVLKPEDYIKNNMDAAVFHSHTNWHARLNTPFTLGADEYYVCGDNRDVSEDSRSIGPVSKKQIQGVAVKILKADSFGAKLIKLIYRPDKSDDGTHRIKGAGEPV